MSRITDLYQFWTCPVQNVGHTRTHLERDLLPPDVTTLLRSTIGAIDHFPPWWVLFTTRSYLSTFSPTYCHEKRLQPPDPSLKHYLYKAKNVYDERFDVSGAVHTVLPWEAFGGHVPSGGSEMYWFDQSRTLGAGAMAAERVPRVPSLERLVNLLFTICQLIVHYFSTHNVSTCGLLCPTQIR